MRLHLRFWRAVCSILFAFVALSITSSAQPAANKATGQPPLLDRELFFGNPEIAGAQISPDGKFIAFLKPYKDTRNIWVKRAEEPFSAAKLITSDTKRPIPAYFWSRDGKYILFVQDKAGDENYNVYAVNPAEAPPAGEEAPKARNLTDLKKVTAQIYALPKSDPDLMYVGINDRDQAWHDLYQVKMSTGERTLIRKNTERFISWVFDLKDQLRLAIRSADNGDTEVLRVDGDGFKKVYSCNVFESCGPVRYHKDGKRVYMVTNKGREIDLVRLVLFDPETGKEDLVESDPLNRVDLGSPIFSNVSDELIATAYEDERSRIYWRDKSFESDYELLKKHLPNKDVNFVSSTKDETLWLISAASDVEPGETHLFDRKTKKLTMQYRIREKLPREHLAEMKPIRYKSSDGLEIPAYLTLPKGIETKNLPLIVNPHGGPWARDSWGYDTFAQFLANRGYAVLQMNFRGSTGYGEKFLDAGNKEWGDKMQDDITWGVKHLVAQGIADPKRVGIMGGSYGGYATLAGVAFTPDVYAAAVSIVGPSNLITLLESIPPYWEAFRKVFTERMGDPATAEGKARLDRQSPLNSANKIKTPLFVVQGANDPRVKQAESDQIVVALRERNFPVEYIIAPDEGHGFARPVNNMAMIAATEKFLSKYLSGRYQEGAGAEVATRLKEITVDVKTVERPKRIEAASVGSPKPAADLRPGKLSYQAKLEIAGQSIQLNITTEIKEESGAWQVIESANTPMGDAVDTAWVEKGSLTLTKRSVKQGPMTIEVEFKNDKATGSMDVGGGAKPIAAETGGALFADGPGTYQALASLPLVEGYAATFRNFDLQKQKGALKQVKVTGAEKLTVPAGDFETVKLEVTSAEGEPGKTTIWVAKDSRKVVKFVAVLPQMNGATLTSELTQ
ncbi:MAG TPA: alpha/beta fold hydrolase [Blastocatellia bacterium]|nr:alpha/beta fold hydrolase [Blastocatellia bacterium]